MAGRGFVFTFSRGREGLGTVWSGRARRGRAGHGEDLFFPFHAARHGSARSGAARWGSAWSGRARQGFVFPFSRGRARLGAVWRGAAWHGPAWLGRDLFLPFHRAWRGVARSGFGAVGLGSAWRGRARIRFYIFTRLGAAGHGAARQGKARSGGAGRGLVLPFFAARHGAVWRG